MISSRLINSASKRVTNLLGRQCSRGLTYDSDYVTDEVNETARERQRSERCVNKVTLIGRVGKEGVLRGTEQQPCLILPLATNYVFKSSHTGELVSKTDWHRICVFIPGVLSYAKRLSKGDRIYVAGSLSYHQVVDENQKMKSITSIIANEMILLSRRRAFEETKSDDE